MQFQPSHQADDMGAIFVVPSEFKVETTATGVPKYKMEGSISRCITECHPKHTPETLRFLLSNSLLTHALKRAIGFFRNLHQFRGLHTIDAVLTESQGTPNLKARYGGSRLQALDSLEMRRLKSDQICPNELSSEIIMCQQHG